MKNSKQSKPQWDDFRFVEAVARCGSLNQAAQELDVEQTTVSYRIMRLERAIGKQLFSRSKHGAKPTVPGQRMAEAVTEAATLFKRAMDIARTGASAGEVKIASPEGLAILWLPRFSPWFSKRYEQVALTISPVDHTREDQAARFDSTLRLLEPSAQDVISKRIGTLHYLPYASDAYIRKHGKPKTREDLLKHRLLDLTTYVVGLGDWVRWVGDERIRRNLVLTTDFTAAFISAMRNGMGIGLLPSYVSCLFPDLVACDVGLKLPSIGIWHVYRERSGGGPPNPAVALIQQAFDERKMPWFSQTYIPPDDFFKRARTLGIPLT